MQRLDVVTDTVGSLSNVCAVRAALIVSRVLEMERVSYLELFRLWEKHLRRDDHLITVTTLLHPFADEFLRRLVLAVMQNR